MKDNKLSLDNFFTICPDYILMGEWLIKHSIPYDATTYQNFYIFDVYNSTREEYVPLFEDAYLLDMIYKAGLKTIKCDMYLINPALEDLKKVLEFPSSYGAPFREGIVIKNYDFVNKWGRKPYGKLLHETFKEVKSRPKAPISPDAIELAIQAQYVTAARVEKICNKISLSIIDPESVKLEMKHIPQVINMVWYDIITEDMNDILKRLKDPTINFKLLKKLVFERAKEYFIKSLQQGVSHEG